MKSRVLISFEVINYKSGAVWINIGGRCTPKVRANGCYQFAIKSNNVEAIDYCGSKHADAYVENLYVRLI